MKTKKEAAEFLGVSEKAIERYVAAGKLSKHVEKKEGGGVITYYEEKELQKLKKAMESKATPMPVRHSDTKTALVRRTAPTDFISLLIAAVEQRSARPQVDLTDRTFLTIKEAAALAGLSVKHIEWAIKQRKLKVHRIPHVRGRRIKQAELDAYVKKL